MLGEDHSLLHDFSEHKERIKELSRSSSVFKRMADEYHKLDSEIRALELKSVPVADDYFNEVKHNRSVLKDKLYQHIKV